MAVFLMIISILTSSVTFYLAMIIGVLFLLKLSGLSFLMMARNARPFVLLVAVTALYHLIFSARDSSTVVTLPGIRLTSGGLYMAASFSLRVLVFVGIAFFVSFTTMPIDMAAALVGWIRPLRKVGVPVDDIGLIIFIAMRFIPVLAEEFDIIRKAQIVRGVDFSGGLINKSRKMTSLLIPVFQSAIRRADALAIAIESRGYVSGAERSSYRQFRWRYWDLIFMMIAAAFTVVLYVLTYGDRSWR
jgi:energy-coupling factor transport system permease protein